MDITELTGGDDDDDDDDDDEDDDDSDDQNTTRLPLLPDDLRKLIQDKAIKAKAEQAKRAKQMNIVLSCTSVRTLLRTPISVQ